MKKLLPSLVVILLAGSFLFGQSQIPSPVADSTSQPSMKKEVKALMAVIPADYDVAVFMNLRTILEDPNLKEALTRSGALLDLDLVVGSFEEQVDTLILAWAFGVGDRLWVLKGSLDTEELINSLKAQGAVVESESESYGAFGIWKVDTKFSTLTLNLTITPLNDSTVIFARRDFPSEGLGGVDAVRAALDTVKGSRPGFLSDESLKRLFESAPLGFHMMVYRHCDIDDCEGFVVSHTKEGEDLVFNMILGFSDPVIAQGILSGLKEEMLTQGNMNPSDILEATVVGSKVRLRVKGDVNKVNFMSAQVPR
ncbi:hypothetical protein MYX75_01295 [Acidobacteria bacterium AH-259-A15]|nr:hypothetical protein [Acidobacteria bacterium AH-259-A15]